MLTTSLPVESPSNSYDGHYYCPFHEHLMHSEKCRCQQNPFSPSHQNFHYVNYVCTERAHRAYNPVNSLGQEVVIEGLLRVEQYGAPTATLIESSSSEKADVA